MWVWMMTIVYVFGIGEKKRSWRHAGMIKIFITFLTAIGVILLVINISSIMQG